MAVVEEAIGGPTAARAEAALRALTADMDFLDEDALAHRSLACENLRRILAAQEAQLVARWQATTEWSLDGHTNPRTALAHRAGLSRQAAKATVDRARRLPRLPVVAAALAAGRISLEQADMLCRLTIGRFASHAEAQQDLLLQLATSLNHAQFALALTHWKRCADPDGPEPPEPRSSLHLRKLPDGRVTVKGELDPIGGHEVREAVDRIERQMFEADWAEARAKWGDAACIAHITRTPAQRRADALVELARRASATPAGSQKPEPLVIAVTDPATATDALDAAATGRPPRSPDFATSICELLDGTIISPLTLARLIREGRIDWSFTRETAAADIVRHGRLFTGRLRQLLDLRDRHCQWPGCDRPAAECQGDHVRPAHEHGPTSLQNGQLLCPGHNRRKDPAGGPSYIVERAPTGETRFWRPDGTPIDTQSTLSRPRTGDDEPP